MKRRITKVISVLMLGTALTACNSVLDSSVPKHERPVPNYLVTSMKAKGMTLGAPILLRIFKEENVMEVWKQDHKKQYALLNSYEICRWSGKLGPKYKEGDRQAPEGFYHVTPGLMNPNSSYHLSFNLGFPNTYDRANNRTGSFLMVHGDCSSAGCYSMTDEYIEEIYALGREAFRGGQKAFQVQAYPFRMTAENMAKKIGDPKFEFWKMLKEGSDHFEVANKPPQVDVCEKRYVFNRIADEGETFNARKECPSAKTPKSLALAFNAKQSKDQEIFDKILKRDSNNPFIKSEDKPKIINASIKANPTIGLLAILEPPKPVPAVLATPTVKPVTPDTAPTTDKVSDEPIATQEFNPISAEVVKTEVPADSPESATVSDQGAASSQAIIDEAFKIAVPEPAKRNDPQS